MVLRRRSGALGACAARAPLLMVNMSGGMEERFRHPLVCVCFLFFVVAFVPSEGSRTEHEQQVTDGSSTKGMYPATLW